MNTQLNCLCGTSESTPWATVQTIPIVQCACGIRRVKSLDVDKYLGRYTSGQYHAEDRTKDIELPGAGVAVATGHKRMVERFDHDYEVALLRLAKVGRFLQPLVHNDRPRTRLLDVGSSNGAFMKAAHDNNYIAFGCDLAKQAVPEYFQDKIRLGELKTVGYQRRTFDVITFNDVLEHMVNPIESLKAAQGLLKRSGILVVEIPDMGSALAKEKGADFHHVKPHEHLWYLTANQLKALLEECGFNIIWMDAPIPGKVTAYASPAVVVEEVQVFGPPGVGDTLWTLQKLQAIRQLEAPCKITYIVCVPGTDKMATRAKDFLLLNPDIDAVEFRSVPLPRDVGNEDPTYPIYELFPNNYLDPQGKDLIDWRPEFSNNWDFGLETPQCAIDQVIYRLKDIDVYAAFYISSLVWNSVVAQPDWTPRHYAELFIKLADAGVKPVVIGAYWDDPYAKEVAAEIVKLGRVPEKVFLNTCGRTTVPLAMAYMELADVTVGVANGLPMIPVYQGRPVVMLWPEKDVSNTKVQFCKEFQTNWVPPDVRLAGTYTPLCVGGLTVDKLFNTIMWKINPNKLEQQS